MSTQPKPPGEVQGMNPRAAHIAFFNIPADGHLNPNLAFAAELVRRGHRVSFSIDEQHAPQVRATGARPVVYETTFPRADRGERFPLHDVTAMSSLFLEEAIAVLPQQRKAFADDRPDVVLYDYAALSAQVLAHEWGCPPSGCPRPVCRAGPGRRTSPPSTPRWPRTRSGWRTGAGSAGGSTTPGSGCRSTTSCTSGSPTLRRHHSAPVPGRRRRAGRRSHVRRSGRARAGPPGVLGPAGRRAARAAGRLRHHRT